MKHLRLTAAAVALCASSALAAGGVHGTVTFSGKPPAAKKVNMVSVPECAQANPDGLAYSPVQISSKGGLANVFIYVKKGLEGKTFEPPKEAKVILNQKGCWYTPRIFGIMVGQPLVVKNSDPVMHNVNAQPYFNIPTEAGNESEKIFNRPKVMLRLRCNIHFWMSGFAGVVDNPYYAVSGADGSYTIPNLPPGQYTLGIWHETLGEQTQEITVAPGGTAVDIAYGHK